MKSATVGRGEGAGFDVILPASRGCRLGGRHSLEWHAGKWEGLQGVRAGRPWRERRKWTAVRTKTTVNKNGAQSK